jgi:O-antigen/teichoic acid export membrane protein
VIVYGSACMAPTFSLRKSVSLLAGTAIAAQALNGLSVLVQAHFYRPETIGYIANALSAAIILAPVCTLQLALAVPQQRDPREVARLVGTLLSALAIGIVVLVVAGLLLVKRLLPAGTALQETWPAALLLIPFIATFDMARLLAAREGAFRAVGLQNIFSAAGRMLFQLAGGLMGGSLTGLMFGEAGGRLLAFGAMRDTLANVARTIFTTPLRPGETLRRHWRFPLISMPSSLLDNLGGYLPPILIGNLYGIQAAGWLFLAQRAITLPVNLTAQTTADVVQVRAAHVLHGDRGALLRFVTRAATILALLGVALAVVLWFFTTELWGFVFSPKWEVSRHMALAFLVPIPFQIVAGPLSRILVVAHRQSYKLLFDVSFLAAALSPLLPLGGHAATPEQAVWRIAIGYVAAYLIYVVVIVAAAANPLPADTAHPAG